MRSDDAAELLEELKESLHYTLNPDMTYVSMLRNAKNNCFNQEKLQAAFNRTEELRRKPYNDNKEESVESDGI